MESVETHLHLTLNRLEKLHMALYPIWHLRYVIQAKRLQQFFLLQTYVIRKLISSKVQNKSARNRQKKAGAREDTLCSLVFQGGEPCLKIVDLLLKEIGFSL